MNPDNKNQAASDKKDRTTWNKIRGLRAVRRDTSSYNGLIPDMWTIIEVTKAEASVKLCSLFDARSWCVKEAKYAKDYLPLYYFMRSRGDHLSLLGCYSDHDVVLSDRKNENMYKTDRLMFMSLARQLLIARPKCLVSSSVLSTCYQDIGNILPYSDPKARAIILKTMMNKISEMM